MKKLVLLLLVFFIGCVEESPQQREARKVNEINWVKDMIPTDSKNIQEVGNRCYTFEWRDQNFLFTYYQTYGDIGKAITRID